ncbi:MAG: response regulator transcription factor [Myxococcales bacterium]|nr:response regulator transcription factor [Myxococcales bacterium]
MDTILLISAVDPSRSPIVAALEGEYDVVRRSPDMHPIEYRTMALDGIILEISDGLPVIAAIRRLSRTSAVDGTPLLIVVDSARVALLHQTPEIYDFIIKPFANDELRLRLSRMITGFRGSAKPGCLEANGLRLLLDEHQAYVDERPVNLTLREFALLRHLVSHRGRAFDRDQLVSAVWGFDYEGGSRTVDIHIRRLRIKLGDRIGAFLQTVHGVGYRFRDKELG